MFVILKIIYNLLAYLFQAILPLLSGLSPKMSLFVSGRKQFFGQLNTIDFKTDEWYWFHCASLGEFEQALPLISKLKESTQEKVVVTFFSPSGYEQKKNHKLLDAVMYLPIDTPKNANSFVETVKPKAAFFIKYEFWENYFSALNAQQIPIYMVSAAFRKDQLYFKWYGTFFKQILGRVTHFFVQNSLSLEVLKLNGFENASFSGDTRFDRVYAQLSMDNQLDFVEKFKANRLCVVLGSTWPDCETAFVNVINKSPNNVCFVIAPHEIKKEKIDALKNKLSVQTSVFSEEVNFNAKVLIIDAIGYLTRIYNYADIAYVGGAIGTTGLHNILEPAVFGMPILIGPNTHKFPEAKALENYGGVKVVTNSTEFEEALTLLISDDLTRNKMAQASANFIKTQVGATQKVLSFIA